MTEINMNVHVQVVLTKFGAEVYNKFYEQFPLDWRPGKHNEGDVLEDTLWHLFQIYGETFHMGMREVPFKDNKITLLEDKS